MQLLFAFYYYNKTNTEFPKKPRISYITPLPKVEYYFEWFLWGFCVSSHFGVEEGRILFCSNFPYPVLHY